MTDRPFEKTRYLDAEEYRDLERALVKLEDVQLGDDDWHFVDDLGRRVIEFGRRTIVTHRQWKELERLKEKYLE
jgi:hypothetical protein